MVKLDGREGKSYAIDLGFTEFQSEGMRKKVYLR
jgi:hypothetical protein